MMLSSRALFSCLALLACAAALAQPADDGEWRFAGKDPANTRFSALNQITAANASQLQLAFSFSTGLQKGHEAAPIVADNTMFIVGPFPNPVFALDLTKPGAPLKWKFEPKPEAAAQGIA